MSTPFEDQVSVWTFNNDPDWTDRNSGISDMVLIDGLSRDRARFAASRILTLRPDLTFELRDIHGHVLETVQVTTTVPVKPSRRALGTGGRRG